ncbi:hypothetical protein [Nocardia vermiculata]|uniref:Uncharacterized protein n=1 Tax=Nocardia vermiculata TaxID=257274 RepID=A0A846XT11_9NOCA|nr:hypothetical protein [Nocardia vermiculata]NKY48914.1 hypothetical protein [Nocardia vermiculata]
MADDTQPKKPGPLASLIQQAQDGSLTVSFSQDVMVNADEFAYIERDCQAFKDEIRRLQGIAKTISARENWGLGEENRNLTLAQSLVGWYRDKAGSETSGDTVNCVWSVLDQHYRIVDDIQTLHHQIAQMYVQTDEAFAAEYNRLTADMPSSPIGKEILPGSTPRLGKSW